MIKTILKYFFIVWFCFFPPIAIHELGHFVVAKLTNLQTKEISIGFGPGISKQINNDTYSLRLLPLGGFVRLEDENNEIYHNEHLLTLLIGPLNNIFLAIFCFFIYYFLIFKNMQIYKEGNDTYFKFKDNQLFKSIKSNIYKTTKKEKESGIEISDFDPINNFTTRQNNFKDALIMSLKKVNLFNYKDQYFKDISKIFFLQDLKEYKNALGPIGIMVEAVKQADRSLLSLIHFVGELSLSVGILNLLPIYPLDGGKIWPIILKIKDSTAVASNPQELNLIQIIGLLTFFSFFSYIMLKDIGIHIKRLYNYWRKK